MSPQEHELGQKYAFGTFVLRPFDLRGISLTYGRDALATPRVRCHLKSVGDWLTNSDTTAFATWLLDGEREDYLDLPRLATAQAGQAPEPPVMAEDRAP
jgi:hypothetical protein